MPCSFKISMKSELKPVDCGGRIVGLVLRRPSLFLRRPSGEPAIVEMSMRSAAEIAPKPYRRPSPMGVTYAMPSCLLSYDERFSTAGAPATTRRRRHARGSRESGLLRHDMYRSAALINEASVFVDANAVNRNFHQHLLRPKMNGGWLWLVAAWPRSTIS